RGRWRLGGAWGGARRGRVGVLWSVSPPKASLGTSAVERRGRAVPGRASVLNDAFATLSVSNGAFATPQPPLNRSTRENLHAL
ncbi:hypothetical protein ACFWX6_21085, partial [Amycolatopsis sp. NPDC059019]|uniref:hypothetical protein n=1 Tax=Amycolatopsis sp. NPDC059019 TaxID=3346702 RepID=UPI00366D56BC